MEIILLPILLIIIFFVVYHRGHKDGYEKAFFKQEKRYNPYRGTDAD